MSEVPASDSALRNEIIETCCQMNALGINQGTSGNVSLRVPGGMLISPSGRPYDALQPEDIVFLDEEGRAPEGQRKPSSEWRLHRDILAARPEAHAVVHVHAPSAAALSCLRRSIPAFHYMVAVAGGDSIRCAAYATFGTAALAENTLAALEGRSACLLANHGLVALGASTAKALALAVEVEALADQYRRALQIGEPVILPPEEMQRVLLAFEDYRRP